MKAFDEVLGLVRRYAPTLIAHLMLFVWLSLFVLDPLKLPNSAVLWKDVSGNIDAGLKAVGLKLERWYVIAALALAYATLFEWLRGLVLSLPVLRIVFRSRHDGDLLTRACTAFRMEPEPYKVRQALSYEVDRALERARQATNQQQPYQFLVDQRLFFTSWYGTVLILLAAVLIWIFEGSQYVRRDADLRITAAILGAGALGLRWYVQRLEARWRRGTGYWAIDQYVRDAAASGEDPLQYARWRAIERRVQEEAALRRTPAALLSSALDRAMPRQWRERLPWRINFPRRADEQDWLIAAARRTRHGDAARNEPLALSTEAFTQRFELLLEREGAGLAVLAAQRSALALVAPGGGAFYSFATRRHEYSSFGIVLEDAEDLDDPQRKPTLRLRTGEATGFIACAGLHPIEKLVAGEPPVGPDVRWSQIMWGDREPALWIPAQSDDVATVGGVQVARTAPLQFGASYVLGIRTEIGTVARVALQCFRIGDSRRVLLAWCILDVDSPSETSPTAPPWWKPAAWKGLLRKVEPKP